MAEAKPKTKLTYRDYCKTPDDERWELLNGELVMAPSANTAHQMICIRLASLLHTFVTGEGLGQAFVAPYDVVLSETNVLQPDILFVSTDRQEIITAANIQGAPDLVVEILSPSSASRDWRIKLDLYGQHGVQEYWVVDPDAQRVWVLVRSEDRLIETGHYSSGDTLTSTAVTGFSVSLDQVFQAPLTAI